MLLPEGVGCEVAEVIGQPHTGVADHHIAELLDGLGLPDGLELGADGGALGALGALLAGAAEPPKAAHVAQGALALLVLSEGEEAILA